MEMHGNITQLYTPIQPTIKHCDGKLSYVEFQPDPQLQTFIHCYWELRSNAPLQEDIICKIVADGCIDIFFDLNRSRDHFVMGFYNQHTNFIPGRSFHYVGVRFLPTVFPYLFKVNAAELTNRIEQLDAIHSKTALFIRNNFSAATDIDAIKRLFNSYFREHIAAMKPEMDKRLHVAVNNIFNNSGSVNIEKDLNTGLTIRQLRRLFEFYIGDSIKSFCRVVRFQHILRLNPTIESLRKDKTFYELGFYDQSHFIKEFKNYYGETPTTAFR